MKCPKCRKETSEIYIEQEFITKIKGTKFDGDYDYDFEAGYTDLREWLDNMLLESDKKPKILGCPICIN